MELQWPLILFTSILAWSAGLFGTQGVYALRGEAKKAQMPALITSFVLMVIAGIAVFFHLQHWERIFNGFGHLTSGITQELIGIVVMFIIMVIFFVYLRRSADDPSVPKWAAWLAIIVAIALCCVMAHSYMMPSRPAWNSVFQLLSIVGVACALGPGTMAFLASRKEADDAALNGKTNWIGTIINLITTCAYAISMAFTGSQITQVTYYFDPTGPTRGLTEATSLSSFTGSSLVFTLVSIICAAVAVLCAYKGKKAGNWKTWGLVIAILAIVSAICLRVVFYQMGASVYPYIDLR